MDPHIPEEHHEALRNSLSPFDELKRYISSVPETLLRNRHFIAELTLSLKALELTPRDRTKLLHAALRNKQDKISTLLVKSTPQKDIAVCLEFSKTDTHPQEALELYQTLRNPELNLMQLDLHYENELKKHGF